MKKNWYKKLKTVRHGMMFLKSQKRFGTTPKTNNVN